MADAATTANLSAYEARRKSTGVAYLWWFFLGLFGAHRLYAARDASGWWLMALHVGGWALLAAAFFWGSDRSTQTYETAFGVASMTSITATAKGSALFWTGNALRGVAWLWWLIDIFLVPGLVRRWNSGVAAELGLGGLR